MAGFILNRQRSLRVFQYFFNIDRDIDFIAHNDTAAVDCILPTDSKVLTIDLS